MLQGNRSLAVDIYNNGFGAPHTSFRDILLAAANSTGTLVNILYPGYSNISGPIHNSNRVYAGIALQLPFQMHATLHALIYDVQGTVLMTLWDQILEATATRIGRADDRTVVRRAMPYLDRAWHMWAGDPAVVETCIDALAAVIDNTARQMGTFVNGTSTINTAMASTFNQAAVAIRTGNRRALNAATTSMLSNVATFGLQFIVRNAWTVNFGLQCHSPSATPPYEETPAITVQSMVDVAPMTLSLVESVGAPADRIQALYNAIYGARASGLSPPTFQTVTAAVRALVEATPALRRSMIGTPVPEIIGPLWGVENITTCRVIPNPTW